MNGAATHDFRGRTDWPVIAKVLATGPAPGLLAQGAVSAVSAWVAGGASLLGQNQPTVPPGA